MDGPARCSGVVLRVRKQRPGQAAAAATIADAVDICGPTAMHNCTLRDQCVRRAGRDLATRSGESRRTRGAVISSALFAVEWRLAIGGDVAGAAKASVPLRHRQHATSRMYRAAHDLHNLCGDIIDAAEA